MSTGYHHGDLRRVMLRAAAETVATEGVDALSLRDLARRAGVSHSAPAHHFAHRRGLLTALATEGHDALADRLVAVEGEGFEHVAVAYVRFALDQRGHYAVMHRADLLDEDNCALQEARAASTNPLRRGVAGLLPCQRGELSHDEAALAAWALVHGIAGLALDGRTGDAGEVERFALRCARQLFRAAD
ncbi:transcriptional regulator, TetR family [Kytococcus aerolatus]|uniref:Transcriptional regulator, TetR family n=1 Tax=Kytococcus aerolatus TaxID=592308 RepID=A0A212T1H6_9MICO|nr:TetR/AcrR family transcriptional regulator [Kytococcus aerolatus]SNC59624.1 transcriptional regulator, TetR family [Kytococcus aerolatus]